MAYFSQKTDDHKTYKIKMTKCESSWLTGKKEGSTLSGSWFKPLFLNYFFVPRSFGSKHGNNIKDLALHAWRAKIVDGDNKSAPRL